MEFIMRGKWIFENAKTKSELISALRDRIEFIKALPDYVEIENAADGQDKDTKATYRQTEKTFWGTQIGAYNPG